MADAKGAYIGGVPVQFKDAAARKMISDEYNSAETYAKGNLCIYNGKIYEAIKETTGTWDATAWEETTLAKVNSKLNGDIANLTEKTDKKIKNCSLMYVIKNVTIPSGINTTPQIITVDFDEDLPTGATIVGIESILGRNKLPFIDNENKYMIGTWISSVDKRSIKITNRSSAWNNYAGCFIIKYR